MSAMSELDSQIHARYVGGREYTEDGDFTLTVEVTADTVEAARNFGHWLAEKCECPRSSWRWNKVWLGKGGKLVTTYTIFVDGIEFAIERSNDYHAFMRDMGQPDHAF